MDIVCCIVSRDDNQCLFSIMGAYKDVSLQARVRLLQSRAEVTGRLCLITRGARWTLASLGQVAHEENGSHAWPLAYVGGPEIGFGVGCAGAHVSKYKPKKIVWMDRVFHGLAELLLRISLGFALGKSLGADLHTTTFTQMNQIYCNIVH